jgi:signal transduction histidine kinase
MLNERTIGGSLLESSCTKEREQMKDVLEKLKHIPIPIWIGLGLVLIFILLMNRNSSSSSGTTAGPVTGATVGSQGSQAGAGTDQQLGNLSQMNQTGFNEIMHQEQASADQQSGMLQSILANMNTGVGTTMHQLGGSIQTAQNATAQVNAVNGTAGQNAGTQPSGVSNHTLVGHYTVALPGGGNVTVNASSPQAAIENAAQETGMDTSHSNVTTVSPPHSDI